MTLDENSEESQAVAPAAVVNRLESLIVVYDAHCEKLMAMVVVTPAEMAG